MAYSTSLADCWCNPAKQPGVKFALLNSWTCNPPQGIHMLEERRGLALLVAVSEAKQNSKSGNDHNRLIKLASTKWLDTDKFLTIPIQVKPRHF